MNLLEHHAKALLHNRDLPVPASWLVKSGEELPSNITFPVVAKSQVPVGGRGKAGGIIVIESADGLPDAVENLLRLPIKGHVPKSILLEEKVEAKRELYLSLQLNRDDRNVVWLVSASGGVDIESNADSVQKVSLDNYATISTALAIGIERLQPLLDSMRRCFDENDLLLLEVNPLIEQIDNSLVCADAKILVDDNARFRHPELPWPEQRGNNLPQPLGGKIGCIANGAGMAMSTMDTIVSMGGMPANFLDIGGGTGEKEFVTALRNIMALPGITSIIVNIFAGISRCDEIARGIIAAREQISSLPPLFIRLEGTNRDIAVQLLNEAEISIEPDLKTCVQKAMEVAS